jgi:diadenosine tetraphosphate (Ap4A) HIT family hydrolase
VVETTRHTITAVHTAPLGRGHVVVAPLRHAPSLQALTRVERVALIEAVVRIQAALRAYGRSRRHQSGADRQDRQQGSTLLLNELSSDAAPDAHVHLHVLPRAPGDAPRLLLRAMTRALSALAHGRALNADVAPHTSVALDDLAGRLRRYMPGSSAGSRVF